MAFLPKNCAFCGDEFVPRSSQSLYCDPCRPKPKTRGECEHCGTSFYYDGTKGTVYRFCSTHCRKSRHLEGPDYEVNPETDCWVWLKTIADTGYPRMEGANTRYAHRIYYERAHGAIPPGMLVHHRCENKLCVNPAHLEAMTRGDHLRYHLPATKLSPELVSQICSADGTPTEIAKKFGVSRSHVSRLRKRYA